MIKIVGSVMVLTSLSAMLRLFHLCLVVLGTLKYLSPPFSTHGYDSRVSCSTLYHSYKSFFVCKLLLNNKICWSVKNFLCSGGFSHFLTFLLLTFRLFRIIEVLEV